jgi:hypothetical protein
LAEKKKSQKEKTKLWNPESPDLKKLLYSTLHWENRRAPAPPETLAPTYLGDTDKQDWMLKE